MVMFGNATFRLSECLPLKEISESGSRAYLLKYLINYSTERSPS